MLILTRRKNEKIQIGDDISVTIIRISGNKVRLGISAPRGKRVVRVELESDCDGKQLPAGDPGSDREAA